MLHLYSSTKWEDNAARSTEGRRHHKLVRRPLLRCLELDACTGWHCLLLAHYHLSSQVSGSCLRHVLDGLTRITYDFEDLLLVGTSQVTSLLLDNAFSLNPI